MGGTGTGVLAACGADNQSINRKDELCVVVGCGGAQVSGVSVVVSGELGYNLAALNNLT